MASGWWPSGYICSQQNANLGASAVLGHHLEAILPLPPGLHFVESIYNHWATTRKPFRPFLGLVPRWRLYISTNVYYLLLKSLLWAWTSGRPGLHLVETIYNHWATPSSSSTRRTGSGPVVYIFSTRTMKRCERKTLSMHLSHHR
jgi:hypothetical protein